MAEERVKDGATVRGEIGVLGVGDVVGIELKENFYDILIRKEGAKKMVDCFFEEEVTEVGGLAGNTGGEIDDMHWRSFYFGFGFLFWRDNACFE